VCLDCGIARGIDPGAQRTPHLGKEGIIAVDQTGELPQQQSVERQPEQQLVETVARVGQQAGAHTVPNLAQRGDDTGMCRGGRQDRQKKPFDHQGIEGSVGPGRRANPEPTGRGNGWWRRCR